MLKRFIEFYKNHIKLFILDMFSAFSLAGLSLVYPMITRKVINDAIPNKDLGMIIWLSVILLGVYF
jgi:ATP-binding cassette subfamily B protein